MKETKFKMGEVVWVWEAPRRWGEPRGFNGIVKDIKESLISGKMWYSILTPYGIVDEFEESRIEELNDPKAQG